MPRDDLKPEEEKQPFDMVEATLERLDVILKGIADLDSSTEIPRGIRQGTKITMVQTFTNNAVVLLEKKEAIIFSDISDKLKVNTAKLLRHGKETGNITELFNGKIELLLNALLRDVQRELVNKGYYSKRSK